MALTTASNRVVATGDNSTTIFYFNRLLYDATHLEVYLDGVLQSTGYTVSGVPGTATYVTFITAPGTGVQVLLLRVVPLTQLSVYDVAGAFPAKTTEKNFDMTFMALQQFDEINDRAVTLPVNSTLTVTDIPDPANPANYNRGIKIKGDGSGLDTFVVTGTASGVVTTKGDLHIYGAGAEDRMPVGANGSFLISASGQTRGLKYFTPGTDGYVLQSDSAQTDKLIWVAPNQPRNPIINGNMEIWQRGTSFVSPGFSVYTADRWQINKFGGGAVTVNRSTNVPSLASSGLIFNYSLEVDVTTADVSVDAADLYRVDHIIEGYNWRHFSNRQFTISFWVFSSKTGIHSFCINSGSVYYTTEYTISSANTWEYKTITVPSTATVMGGSLTNGNGAQLQWTMMAGSNYSTGVVLNAWTAGLVPTSTNQVNVINNTANFFRLTGVKLELGSIATPIQFVPFEEELIRCQRYYFKTFPYATAPAQNAGTTGAHAFGQITGASTAGWYPGISLPTTMRTAGTGTSFNPSAANAQPRNAGTGTDYSSIFIVTSENAVSFTAVSPGGSSAGQLSYVQLADDAEL